MSIPFYVRNGVVWDAEPESLLRFLSQRNILSAVDLDSDGETVIRIGVDENGLTAGLRDYGGLGVGLHVDALVGLLREHGFDAKIDGVPEVPGDDDEFFDDSVHEVEPADETLVEAGSFEETHFEAEPFDEDVAEKSEAWAPRSVLASRLGSAWGPLLANMLHADVEQVVVLGWSIMRFADPTFSPTPSAFVNRRELPLIRLFRGDIDLILIQLSPVRVFTGDAATVTLAPGADAGMVPSVEMSTLDEEGRGLMRRLLTSVQDVADLLGADRIYRKALVPDGDALALALAPRSIGGPADRDVQTWAALVALGLPGEVVEAMMAIEMPEGARIVHPSGLASAVDNVIVGSASDLSALGSRPPLWARMDDFLRLHPRTAIVLAIAQILIGGSLVFVGVTVGRPIPLVCGTVIVCFGAWSLTVSSRRARSRRP